MTEPDPGRHHEPEHRTLHEDAAHPGEAIDALEERVLGHRMDQDREEDDDENASAHEHPDDPDDGQGTVQHGPEAEPP
jgi:hypothetical protein